MLDVAARDDRAAPRHRPQRRWSARVGRPTASDIVFSGQKGGITDLYVIDADGRTCAALTNDLYGDLQPAVVARRPQDRLRERARAGDRPRHAAVRQVAARHVIDLERVHRGAFPVRAATT